MPIHEVIVEAQAHSLSVQRLTGYGKVLDARLVAIEGRICQIIRTRQVIDSLYPTAVNSALYLPRNVFADFLIYVAFPSNGSPQFYVVPRGAMTKDTMWSLKSLKQYRDAWQVFKQPITKRQTERRFTTVNWQLQAIIDAVKDAALDVTLIGLKKRTQWPTFVQRRVIVGGRKCAVYSCTRLSPDPTASLHNFIFLRIPTNTWAEFQICLVKDGPNGYQIYVIPRGAIQKKTTASLENSDLQSYKGNWKLLSASPSDLEKVVPIRWRPNNYRPPVKLSLQNRSSPIESRPETQPPHQVESSTKIQPPRQIESSATIQPPHQAESGSKIRPPRQIESRPKIQLPSVKRPPKRARPPKKVPEILMKPMLEAQSHGLPVELVRGHQPNAYEANRCLIISQKPCQIMQTVFITAGKHKGRYVPMNGEAIEDWAEFVVFFVREQVESEKPTFYIVPRARLIEDTVVLPTWIRDYKDAWHVLR